MVTDIAESTTTRAIELLHGWLSRCLARNSLSWLQERQASTAVAAPPHVFFTAYSAVPQYTGKAEPELTSKDLQAAEAICSGWMPAYWRVDQLSRTLILLSLPSEDVETYTNWLDRLFAATDVGELVALYQALPLLPHPLQHRARAAEGVRSNMTVVFNAVALRNPYPANYLDQRAWNQMVLKALFIGSPLDQIQGIDRRANADLAQMLVDYAHERWAASRPVSPELWRSVGRFANADLLPDLQRLLHSSDPVQRQAAALACAASADPTVQAQLTCYPDLHAAIQAGQLTWESLSDDRLQDR